MKQEENIHKWLNGEQKDNLLDQEEAKNLEKISHYVKHIDLPKVDVENAYKDFNKHYDKKKSKVVSLRKFALVAASVLLLIFFSTYFWLMNGSTIVKTEIAENEVVVLPDNSRVTLNAASKIEYEKGSWNKERVLTLTGEAYFKVAKGKRFTVKLKEGFVQVLGTEFNIKDRKNYFEVVCYHGKVKVKHANTETILTAGKSFLVKNLKEEYKTTRKKRPSWILKESTYENVPLFVVLDDFERQYALAFDRSKIDVNKLFVGAFPYNDLNVALNAICLPLNLKFEINKKTIILRENE